jgi:hypothetical protein
MVIGFGVLFDIGWRRLSFVKLHDSHLEVSRYRWGATERAALIPNVLVFYENIVDVQLVGKDEIAVYATAVAPPYEMTEPTATITFRPRDAEKVLKAIRSRVEGANEFATERPA